MLTCLALVFDVQNQFNRVKSIALHQFYPSVQRIGCDVQTGTAEQAG